MESYSYDANGNRNSTGYSTGPNNQLLSDGIYNYQYDTEGNLSRRTTIATGATRDFVWDFRNRLASVIDKDSKGNQMQRVDYTYDASNRRISESVQTASGTTTSLFVYDRTNVLLEFQSSNESPLALAERNLFGPAVDQILAQDNGAGKVAWMLTDYLGTIRDIVDNTGAVTDHLVYDSFGNLVSQTNPAATPRYQFTGREFDAATELLYDRARYFDPGAGQFIGQDPLSFGGGDANLYRYVGNGPTNEIDPSGLFDLSRTLNGFLQGLCTFTSGIPQALDNILTFELFISGGGALLRAGGALLRGGGEIGAELGLSSTALARQLGRAGEEAVGITGPKTGIRIPGSDRLRFPDALNLETKTLTEVKNVGSLSYIQQLRDYAAYAQQNKLRFELWVRLLHRCLARFEKQSDVEKSSLSSFMVRNEIQTCTIHVGRRIDGTVAKRSRMGSSKRRASSAAQGRSGAAPSGTQARTRATLG